MKYYDKLIFEISRPGRVGYSLPKSEIRNQKSEITFIDQREINNVDADDDIDVR